MIIKSVIDAEVVKSKNGVKAQKIHDDSNSQAIHLTLEPGARLDTHITPVDVFFYILEGVATIEIGDEKENIVANSVVESPKDIPHAVENSSNSEVLRVLVVKTPHP